MQKSCFRPSRSPLPKLARQCFMLVSMVVPCTLTLSERARLSGTDGEMKMTQSCRTSAMRTWECEEMVMDGFSSGTVQ